VDRILKCECSAIYRSSSPPTSNSSSTSIPPTFLAGADELIE
jgi:hypothetical protein